MEEALETLVRLRRPRKIYLRSIKNSERDILEMIENLSKDDENSDIKPTSAKVSLQDRINKVKQQDEEILKFLKKEDMENELEEILIREEKLQILQSRPKIYVDRNGLPSSNSSLLPKNESVKVKVPKLETFKFNGDVINWQRFWDQFCSAIHEKFSPLKTFLYDYENALISGLSISAANYVQAIELLKDRYGNSQVLISAYMKKFVLLPKIKNNDDIKGLRNLYDHVESSVRNLQTLKVDTLPEKKKSGIKLTGLNC